MNSLKIEFSGSNHKNNILNKEKMGQVYTALCCKLGMSTIMDVYVPFTYTSR